MSGNSDSDIAGKYKIAGTIKIPEDKKAEPNSYVMQILDKCGIRKTEYVDLDGKMVKG